MTTRTRPQSRVDEGGEIRRSSGLPDVPSPARQRHHLKRTSPVSRRLRTRLASARDRQRLAERNQQERNRVERMLATAPMPIETGTQWSIPSPNEASLAPAWMAPRDCPVCGGEEVACDEVMQVGKLRLSQCLRCDHRWTERSPDRWAEVGAPMTRSRRQASSTSRTH